MTGSTSLSTGSTSVTTVTPPALPGPTPPPAIIAIPNSYVIDNTTTIDTANHTIVTGGVGNTGGQFQSVAVSGSPSSYLFGTPSAFDTATGIDANFSVMAGGSAPGAGVTVYRFAGLDVQDDPTVSTTGGAKDIAFVAQNGITSNSSGSAWNVDSLRSLFFGSINGPIVIAKEFRKNSLFSGFQYLRLYARGTTGLVTLDGKISLALASLYVDAQQGINVSNNAKITTLNTVFNTPGTIVFDASPTSATLKLNAGTGIRLNALLGNASVEMTAPLLQTTANLSALTGFLNIGAGGIQAAGNTLSGFDHINVAGNVTAGSISVWNGLNIGGTFKAGAPSGAATLSAGTMAIGGGVDLTAAASRNGGTLTVNARDVNVASTGINGIKADGADGLLALVGGGNGGTVNIGTSIRPVTNSITVDVPISASTGLNGLGALTGGDGGAVNLVARGTVAVNATVMVSDSAAPRSSRTGGKITIDSRKTSGTAIAVNNSGQLLALLNAASPGTGGAVTFVSSGGDIAVTGGTVRADKGTVDIRNNGAGNIALTNATIRGDVVKVGALGANGQLLIGGGTISADTSLKLYGGTSNGQVRFTDNVTLGGSGTKAIAGKTVTIDNGKTVTIGGAAAAKVYTGKPNYTGSGGNNSTSGTFGGVGATTQTFNKRPIF